MAPFSIEETIDPSTVTLADFTRCTTNLMAVECFKVSAPYTKKRMRRYIVAVIYCSRFMAKQLVDSLKFTISTKWSANRKWPMTHHQIMRTKYLRLEQKIQILGYHIMFTEFTRWNEHLFSTTTEYWRFVSIFFFLDTKRRQEIFDTG